MRGATLKDGTPISLEVISIHAPHAGRDETVTPGRKHLFTFQSTRPMRGATR